MYSSKVQWELDIAQQQEKVFSTMSVQFLFVAQGLCILNFHYLFS